MPSRFGRVLRRVRQVWITLGIAATVGFAGWSLIAYRASAAGREATRGDARVAVSREDGVWTFTPAGGGASGSP